MKQAKMYTWKGTDNAKKLYQLLQIICGTDFTQWRKHADYSDALQLAHEHIFGFDDVVKNIKTKALDVQVCFLIAAQVNEPHTTVKRTRQYVSAVITAYDAGVIDRANRDRLVDSIVLAAVDNFYKTK